jgi:hypothetical protein
MEIELAVRGRPFCEHSSLTHDLAMNVSADNCDTELDTTADDISFLQKKMSIKM